MAALPGNGCHQCIRIGAVVGHDEFGRLILNQRRVPLDVGDLSCRENYPRGIAKGIHRDMQLGGQSAARAIDFLLARFF